VNLIVHIPDDLAERLRAGADLERKALEALAVEGYRDGRLTTPELRRLLGFATRLEVDVFLKQRGVFDPTTLADVERDLQDLDRVGI
jgi:hypothetical protein